MNSVVNHTVRETKALQLFFSPSESNFQAPGRNNLKIHLKFLQDLAFSFHISTHRVSQNSVSLQSQLLNLAAECQISQDWLTRVYSLFRVERKGEGSCFCGHKGDGVVFSCLAFPLSSGFSQTSLGSL